MSKQIDISPWDQWNKHEILYKFMDIPLSLLTVGQILIILNPSSNVSDLEEIYFSLKLPKDDFLQGETDANNLD